MNPRLSLLAVALVALLLTSSMNVVNAVTVDGNGNTIFQGEERIADGQACGGAGSYALGDGQTMQNVTIGGFSGGLGLIFAGPNTNLLGPDACWANYTFTLGAQRNFTALTMVGIGPGGETECGHFRVDIDGGTIIMNSTQQCAANAQWVSSTLFDPLPWQAGVGTHTVNLTQQVDTGGDYQDVYLDYFVLDVLSYGQATLGPGTFCPKAITCDDSTGIYLEAVARTSDAGQCDGAGSGHEMEIFLDSALYKNTTDYSTNFSLLQTGLNATFTGGSGLRFPGRGSLSHPTCWAEWKIDLPSNRTFRNATVIATGPGSVECVKFKVYWNGTSQGATKEHCTPSFAHTQSTSNCPAPGEPLWTADTFWACRLTFPAPVTGNDFGKTTIRLEQVESDGCLCQDVKVDLLYLN